ncbi:MAG TPA: MBL fold metallo-hydrolase [Dehalococcoidales bacterium]|nr:MBL fold metallo-hydrolase [Dehalococcoidales bacterium]
MGKLDCLVISDGSLIVPPPPGAAPDTMGEEMEVLSLLIDNGRQKVLIDTGCGEKFTGTDTGKLVMNLKAAGISCDEVEVIVFTHGHIDHCAGTFDKNGKAVFPRARYITARTEWKCWVDKKERKELQMIFGPARQDLLPIPEQFHLAEEGEEILPGIILTTAPGHTPGSAILKIHSDGQNITCVGDLVHSAREFDKPDYYSFLDVDPALAIESRNRIFSDLARSGEMAFVCHFPFPGLGHMVKKDGRWVWKQATQG